MSNIVRLKRRASGGASGAPASLATGEAAYNEVDDILYYGYGDNGSGVATSIKTIAGLGAFMALTGAQTIAGIKTFTSSPVAPTPTAGDSTTKVATTAFVAAAITGGSVADGDKGDIVVSGSGASWVIDSSVATAFGRSIMAAADAATTKTILSLGNVDNTSDTTKWAATKTLTNTTFNANGTGNAIANIETADFAASVIDTDTSLAANSDTRIASQKAVKAYADARIAAADAMIFKGVIDCSANPNYPAADRGDTYRVSVAGKIGGASGLVVEAGDILLCITDGTASGNQATVGSAWSVIQTNIDGAVTLTGTQTLTNKTITSPTLDGTPVAPTASAGTNTTQIATTANVVATIAAATIDGGTF